MSAHSSEISEKTDPGRSLVVSFHDLHPGSREACERFLKAVEAMGIRRITLLVVPCWHGGPPFTKDAAFTKWLRGLEDAGHEICLHGFYHKVETVTGSAAEQVVGRFYTAGEGEFYQISRGAAEKLVERGLAMLRNDAGLLVTGFTPPAWLLNKNGRKALVGAGLKYTTTFSGVELLQSGETISAPTVVWSCRNSWRRFVSRIWVRFWAWRNRSAAILRVAVHPGDFPDPKVEASVYARIREALGDNRTAVAYADLIAARGGGSKP